MNPTIAVSGDTGALELSSAGATSLGVGIGAVLGYFLGKGKTTPILLGAGLGYVLGNTGMIQKALGPK